MMKHILMMTIVLFIVSACNRGKTDSEPEETLAISEEDCKAKGTGWQWDETKKVCKSKVSSSKGATPTTLSLKEKCENKGPNFVWDETKPTDSGPGDCLEIVSKRCQDPAKPIFDYRSKQCMAPYITFFSQTHNFFQVGNTVSGLKCALFIQPYFDEHGIGFVSVEIVDETQLFNKGKVAVCGKKNDQNSGVPCPTEPGVYEILAGRTDFVITKVNKTMEELKALKCFGEQRLSITDRNQPNPSSEWQ